MAGKPPVADAVDGALICSASGFVSFMKTGLLLDPTYRAHEPSEGHPECPERYEAISNALKGQAWCQNWLQFLRGRLKCLKSNAAIPEVTSNWFAMKCLMAWMCSAQATQTLVLEAIMSPRGLWVGC